MTIRSPLRSLSTFAVSVLLLPTPLAAQTSLSVGGGLSLAKVAFSTSGLTLTPSNRVGITVGGSMTMPLSGSVALQIGGAYVQKGTKVTASFLGESASSTLKLGYLELTALAKPAFALAASTGEGSSAFHLLVGPALGIRVGCSTSAEEEGVTETEDCDSDDVTAMDLGVLVGGGVRMGSFRVDASYTLGIMDIDAGEDDEELDSIKNRSISVQVGYVIPMGPGG